MQSCRTLLCAQVRSVLSNIRTVIRVQTRIFPYVQYLQYVNVYSYEVVLYRHIIYTYIAYVTHFYIRTTHSVLVQYTIRTYFSVHEYVLLSMLRMYVSTYVVCT